MYEYKFAISDPDNDALVLLEAFKHRFCRSWSCQIKTNRANKSYLTGNFSLDRPHHKSTIRKHLPIPHMFLERDKPKRNSLPATDPPVPPQPSPPPAARAPAATANLNPSPLSAWFKSRPSISSVLAHGIKLTLASNNPPSSQIKRNNNNSRP